MHINDDDEEEEELMCNRYLVPETSLEDQSFAWLETGYW